VDFDYSEVDPSQGMYGCICIVDVVRVYIICMSVYLKLYCLDFDYSAVDSSQGIYRIGLGCICAVIWV
jgi:hypothetical protein